MWRVWGTEEVHTKFGGETGGKEPLARPRRRWEYKTETDFNSLLVLLFLSVH
jgi:hypothetical protein